MGFLSIVLAMSGIVIMIGDSVSSGSLFGNLVALTIPISFSILIMIVKTSELRFNTGYMVRFNF